MATEEIVSSRPWFREPKVAKWRWALAIGLSGLVFVGTWGFVLTRDPVRVVEVEKTVNKPVFSDEEQLVRITFVWFASLQNQQWEYLCSLSSIPDCVQTMKTQFGGVPPFSYQVGKPVIKEKNAYVPVLIDNSQQIALVFELIEGEWKVVGLGQL